MGPILSSPWEEQENVIPSLSYIAPALYDVAHKKKAPRTARRPFPYARLRSLNSETVMPVIFLNTLLKYCWLEKPTDS